jgi:SAM-dependent methyltransferase
MSFQVTAEAYSRFMGRFSEPLAARFAELARLQPGQRALDVGCGPGALTDQLVERLDLNSVSAIDPSEPFVAALRERRPGLDVRRAGAEHLPFADDIFDASLAQLVVHFMADPVAGLGEMRRVTRPGGTVAACVWDHAGSGGPLSTFWQAVHDTDPSATGEAELAGTREGHLAELFAAAGLREIESVTLTVQVGFASLADWWDPFTLGVGPAGAYVATLDEEHRSVLLARCADLLPPAPFRVSATAWAARARA